MKQQIKVWGSRVFVLALVVVAFQQWGMPMYRQYFVPKKTAVFIPTTKVREAKFIVSFHEVGSLEAEKSVPVMSEVEGKIIQIVADGASVPSGAQIATLDTSALQRDERNQLLQLKNAEEDVKRVKGDLDMLIATNKTEVQKAEKDLEFSQAERDKAKDEFARKTRLVEAKLVAREERDQAELDQKAKELTVIKQELALKLQKDNNKTQEDLKRSEVRKVEFARDIQKTALDEIQGRMKKAVITAPSPGLVVISSDWTADGRRKLQEGDNVRPQQQVCTLPDLSSMQVKVQVGEADAPRIKLGIPVLIKLEAVPNKIFHGTVKDISSLATEASPWDSGVAPGSRNFEVTIAVKEADPKVLKPGISADAEFICKSMDKALYVPLEAVTEIDNKTYVYIKNGSKFRRVEVKTGLSNDTDVVITKGLRKGDIIALRDPTRPADDEQSGTPDTGGEKKTKQPAPVPATVKKK